MKTDNTVAKQFNTRAESPGGEPSLPAALSEDGGILHGDSWKKVRRK